MPRTSLMLLRDRSFISVFLSFFWLLFQKSIALAIIEYLPYLFLLYEDFIRLPCLELEVSYCWSEEKLNHVLKPDGVNLLIDVLINKMSSKHNLSWNFKIVFCLNRRLVWKFLGWKLVILTGFFCKIAIHWIVLKFWAQAIEL